MGRAIRERVGVTALAAGTSVMMLLAGCTVGSSGGGSASPSTSTAAAQGNGAGQAISTATPAGQAVCKGRSVPDIVQTVEPSVVTVRTSKGLGSGIAYRQDMVLTDQHVVARNEGSAPTFDTVEVALADGSTLKGTVVGSDLLTDLAVVTVSGRKPDAPISPGSPGGALVDVCGQVVGVNEAYIPPSSGAVSLGSPPRRSSRPRSRTSPSRPARSSIPPSASG